jgi:LysM repeat protein
MGVEQIGYTGLLDTAPAQAQPVHVMQSGESLQDVASHYGVTTDAILGVNPSIRNPEMVYPGFHLELPPAGGSAAPSDAQPQAGALNTLHKDFAVFDTAAHGGKGDGIVSKHDLQKVAGDGSYSADQRAAAQYILNHQGFYARLDTASQGGSADGSISRGDATAADADAVLFTRTSAFNSTDPSETAESGDRTADTPQGAATQIQFLRQFSDNDTDNPGGNLVSTGYFMNQISAHKNDPVWLQGFFQALGSKETAQYLTNVSDPNRYDGVPESQTKSILADTRTALQTMYQSGTLNDADISRLVESWARQGGDPNTGFAQLFAGIGGPQAQPIKNAFARACTELSLTGQSKINNAHFEFTSDAGKWLSDGDRQGLAAAAAFVLSGTSQKNQASQLIQLHTDGGDAAVSSFISLAMAGPTTTQGPLALTPEGRQRQMQDRNSDQLNYAGVAQLVQNLGNIDPSAMPGSSADLVATRDAVFDGALNGLSQHSDNWESNTTLKDGLSKILMTDYDSLLKSSLLQDHELPTDGGTFGKDLEEFSQHVLLTDPTGKLRDASSKFLTQKLGQMIADINTLSPTQIQSKYGATTAQLSWLAGQLVAHVNTGLDGAVKTASDKQAAKQQQVDFGINLLLAAGTDALKLLPGGGVLDELLPSSITGSAIYGTIKGQLEDDLKKGLTDKAYDLLVKSLPGLHSDPKLVKLRDTLEDAVLDDNTHVGNKGQFQNGYDSVRDN